MVQARSSCPAHARLDGKIFPVVWNMRKRGRTDGKKTTTTQAPDRGVPTRAGGDNAVLAGLHGVCRARAQDGKRQQQILLWLRSHKLLQCGDIQADAYSIHAYSIEKEDLQPVSISSGYALLIPWKFSIKLALESGFRRY